MIWFTTDEFTENAFCCNKMFSSVLIILIKSYYESDWRLSNTFNIWNKSVFFIVYNDLEQKKFIHIGQIRIVGNLEIEIVKNWSLIYGIAINKRLTKYAWLKCLKEILFLVDLTIN